MTAAPVITGCLNAVVLALTPVERWEAAREFNSNFMTERWFILIGIIAIIALTVLLLVVSFNRTRQEQRASGQLFIQYAQKRGLSLRERQILLEVAWRAGLKRSESIFTLGTAFDRGAAKMMEEKLADQQAAEETKQLKAELSYLREKLGFRKQPTASAGALTKSKKLSSRQIPVGRKIHITRRKARDSGDIVSTVIKNSDGGLAIKSKKPIKVSFGEFWCVRYYFGSSVWEFDTSVVSYDGEVLVLNHSDNVRFINRRRFLRVPVKKPAFVACFPFTRSFIESSPGSKDESAVNQDLTKTSVTAWGPPDFVPAVVTELAGPGLRIESSLEVKAGQRILVVLNLGQEQGPTPANRSKKAATSKIVEDIGEVRHTKLIHNGLSIAVELTGLSDSNMDELIRATNAASLSVRDRNRNVPTSRNTVESVPQHAGV